MIDALTEIAAPTPLLGDEPQRDEDAYFHPDQTSKIRRYYDENGYVVVRSLVPAKLCDQARALFTSEVRSFKGFIYRQASANPERHVFSEQGFILNTILNVQSLNPRHFAGFRRSSLDMLTYPEL